MMWYFFGGVLVGFLFSFIIIKRSINKDGAGQLKCCQNCPYFKAASESGE